ncbi:SAM-dependent methyltransferase [Flexivirga sp. ID2601S]|uniref:S-adenosyl-L-methionine-dependent methyltransferase n=1 Tax=Flexivirga aerilata TaxID=1656889 RepID=A0A849AGB0_9MICO|nr:SAM-dependent methyltransferase [Flexivirga aerilata]NNG38248.1 SAM-dependent methyltransferase [Flexivirga aerilata]
MTRSEPDEWDIVSGVGITALAVAAARAIASHRPDRLIDDPWAERFVQAARAPKPLPTRPLAAPETAAPPDASRAASLAATWQMMAAYHGVRTRFFDQVLLAAADTGIRHVVIVAAGLDSRAHRLRWPRGTTVYEIDLPRVLDFKDLVFDRYAATPASERRPVPADLRDDWPSALLAAGFDPRLPSAWLAEGPLAYLPTDTQRALLESVDTFAAPGSSHLAIEDFADLGAQLRDPALTHLSEAVGVDLGRLVATGQRIDPAKWLADHGWRPEAQSATAVADGYGHEFDPLTARFNADVRFVTAHR